LTPPDAAHNGAARLYTPEILGLAVELAGYPIEPHHILEADVRSRSCGSTLAVGLEVDTNHAIKSLGLRVSACAIGQASAAIFARSVKGRTRDDLSRSLLAIEQWLGGSEAVPAWQGLELLDKARAYPGRHEAILLPWRAAITALSNG
jgi:NifU-like protein involved in Fe-S cluster formation